MEQIKEAVYLINDERYLHLRENGAGAVSYTHLKTRRIALNDLSVTDMPLQSVAEIHNSFFVGFWLFSLASE